MKATKTLKDTSPKSPSQKDQLQKDPSQKDQPEKASTKKTPSKARSTKKIQEKTSDTQSVVQLIPRPSEEPSPPEEKKPIILDITQDIDIDQDEEEEAEEFDEVDPDDPQELTALEYTSLDALPYAGHNPDSLPAATTSRLPSTTGTKDALQLYLREIGRFPMLEPDEEFELARRAQEDGDNDAAFRLVSSHLRLVVKIAMNFQRRWMQNVLDLIQEGNVGLMRAVHKFDHNKGIKFSYYAAFWVRAYILKFIMDNWRMVKVGTTQGQRKLFYNLNRERHKLINEGFNPDSNLLSERLGVNEQQVIEMQQRLDTSDVSLNAPLNTEAGTSSRMDFLPALGPGIEESYAGNEIAAMLRHKLTTILPNLSEKELFILENRLLTDDPVTLREIGEKYKITRERVRQLESRLLQKLRTHLTREIKDFSEDWITPQ